MTFTRASCGLLLLAATGCRAPAGAEGGDLPPRGHPALTVQLGMTEGEWASESMLGGVDQKVNATAIDLMVEGRPNDGDVGLGVQVAAITADDSEPGLAEPIGDDLVDLFLHLTFFQGDADDLSLPLRVGFNYQRIEAGPFGWVGSNTIWNCYGGGLEVAPEVRLLYGEQVSLSLFALGGLGLGVANAEVQDGGGTSSSLATQLEMAAGVRLELGLLQFEVGYVGKRFDIVEGEDDEGLLVVPDMVMEFSGIRFSGGLRF